MLGLKNISELHEQFKVVKKLYGKDIDFNSIPLNDEKTWDLIGKGQTLGVFQFASALAISVITKMKPRNIEELSAANAFIRPGASGLEEYIIAKKNTSKIRKLHPDLDKHLDVTYGSIVYQEQIMSLIAEVMGIDFGAADEYRRMLEKADKYPDKLAEWKDEFIKLGLSKGYNQKLVDVLVDLIIENSGYGFNKSHAVSYSIISYWTAYMKANFPLVFYTTLLNGNLDEADSFIAEARQLGIEVLPPHVNTSKFNFSVEDGKKIRAGFNAVKGIGPKAVDVIVANQPFVSVDDFKERTGKAANKKVWEALIKFAAFEGLGIEVEKDDVPYELQEEGTLNLSLVPNENLTHSVLLNRKQMVYWYEKVLEENNKKAPPNYLVPSELIPGKFIDNPNYDLVEEKEGGYVIPEDRLKEFKVNLSVLAGTTRKKPKGMFAKKEISKIPAERRVITLYGSEIAKIKVNSMDVYLEESEELGFSFLAHPLEKHLNKINLYDEVDEGGLMFTAGIVESMVKRFTKNNKPYYWLFIKTPRDKVRVTVWDNQLKQYQSIIKQNNILAVKGFKGYGGMSLEEIKEIKLK